MNMLANLAKAAGRDYITPEDIDEAMQGLGLDIEMDFLEILANQVGIGIEDTDGCAFVLWTKLKEKYDGKEILSTDRLD
jgi:hypothetical protein